MTITNKNVTSINKNTVATTRTTVPVTKEPSEKILELQRMALAQVTAREFAPVSHSSLTKSVTFVTAANGIFRVVKTPIGLFKEQLEEFKQEIIGLPKMESGVDLVIPKIPMEKLIQVLSWYRDVNTQDRTEASVLFFWNHDNLPLPELPGLSIDGQLVIYCPTQTNSGTLSDFSKDDNVTWMRQNLALFLETHSHED